jgi:hypothetical protein
MKTQFFGQNPTGWSLDSRYRYQPISFHCEDDLSSGDLVLALVQRCLMKAPVCSSAIA